MRTSVLLGCALTLACALAPARAQECPGHPDALGTSRTIVVDPRDHTRVGTMHYAETLPLAEKEVVLTFDDGPRPPYTTRILDILASECVKATYFIIGRMAREYPAVVRRIYDEGHTVGTHTENHPYRGLRDIPAAEGEREIDQGIASTLAALGDPAKLAPFFRYSGFGNTDESEAYLAQRGIMVWGADFPADDWMRIGAGEIVHRAMRRLEAKGKGILLLHDIHPATALALPKLLAELKARGYRVVHVVPSGPGRQATPTEPQQWAMPGPHAPLPWPNAAQALKGLTFKHTFTAVAAFGPEAQVAVPLAAHPEWMPRGVDPAAKLEARAIPKWDRPPHAGAARAALLPLPDPERFGVAARADDLVALRVADERKSARRHGASQRVHHASAAAR
jgi:peptidoglycan/xylan/chitin deacetylase (PgdA/CDA1 family)